MSNDDEKKDIVIKHFEGKPIPFRVEHGQLCLTMREIGQALGYEHPEKSVSKLYSEHKDEFDNDCTEIAVSAIPGESRQIRERVFFLEGLYQICFHSEKPLAKKFRKWCRKLARQVQTEGYYIDPLVTKPSKP